MNIKYNILPLFAAVSLLTACSDDDIDRVYTVGEADNAIVLKVGVSEGNGTQISTRGVDDNHSATANGGGHTPFSSYGANGTQLALRIDGMWKTNKVSQSTLVTLGTPTTETTNKHNPIASMAPTLFWDDYGTADPDNMKEEVGENGRKIGLTIYGMGVDGYATSYTSAETISTGDWTNLSWNVGTPSSGTPATIDQNTSNYWKEKDLLTSNNIRLGADGTYKFDDYLFDKKPETTTKKSSNILVFTHAMTKITVVLTAGEGFPMTNAGDATTAHFEAAPTVTLEGFYYTGSVSVEAKTSTPTLNTTANIKMHLNDDGAAHTATFDALVFPGNTFSATIANDDKFTPTSSNNILELNADGNIYKVTAAQLVKAIVGTSTTGEVQGTLEQGKNYILNITVKKTDLDITATILDWKTVEAEEDTPKINVDKVYGHEGSAFAQNFDFFRSTSKENGYSKDAYVAYNSGNYTFHDQLYWPNHQTHYFFRGVYPRIGTSTGEINESNVSSASSNASAILVLNKIYEQDTYPSDLAIGWPKNENDVDFDETCKVHADKEGICATEGQIRMNFKYMMSQVEVELKTVDSPAAKVNIGSKTIVELVNVYNIGAVKLSDGTVTGSGDKGDYPLDNVAGNGNELLRHSAIVPQTLTFTEAGASSNVRFKITVTNDDAVLYTDSDSEVIAGTKNVGDVKTPATTDIYYADINPILKSDKSGKVAPNGKWESGVHYKYTLTLSKTAINVTATLKDWVEVEASDVVWF